MVQLWFTPEDGEDYAKILGNIDASQYRGSCQDFGEY